MATEQKGLFARWGEYFRKLTTKETPENFIYAIRRGDNTIVEKMLENHPHYLHSATLDGQSPVYEAVWWENKEATQLLLDSGADVNTTRPKESGFLHMEDGNTLLHTAVDRGHTDMVNLLLERGANVDIKNNAKETALYTAVSNQEKQIATLLLENGANPSVAEDRYSAHLLREAIDWGDAEIMGSLLEKGADINEVDGNGRDALDLAKERGSDEIKTMLSKHQQKLAAIDVKKKFQQLTLPTLKAA